MCITKRELEEKINEIRKYKALAEEALQIQKSLEEEVILYLKENKLTEEITETARVTYTSAVRTTLNREKLLEIFGEDLKPFERVTTYNVLRIK